MPWPSIEQMLWGLKSEIGEIRGLLSSYAQRLDQIEKKQSEDRVRWSDLLPYLPGAVVILLWLTGRIDTAALVGLLSGR